VFAFYLHMYRQIPDKFAKEQNWKKVWSFVEKVEKL
jgi:hypothetical protein